MKYTFNIMGPPGHDFEVIDADVVPVSEIERRFDELVKDGRVAATLLTNGEQDYAEKFDPEVADYVFYRQLQGG